MTRLLATLTGEGFTAPIYELSNLAVFFVGDMDIDCDGSGGNPDHDPYFQADTSLHYHGKALNAYEVPYVVVPPVVAQRTKGIVLGARALVTHLETGKQAVAVVGDIGPSNKVGEGSPALAKLLGLDPNPNHGGTERPVIAYEIFPGVAAEVNGVLYDLQSYGG